MLLPFVLPAVAVYSVIYLLPAIVNAGISLFAWRGSGPMTWLGPKNYVDLFQDAAFQGALVNTLLILFVVGGAVFLLSFGLIMVMRLMAGKRAATAILFFPNIVSGIVLAILWSSLFQHNGLVNSGLEQFFGVSGPEWWSSDNRFTMIMAALTWIMTGFYVTILMAAVDRIPMSLYEDAEIAGVNALQRFRYVTLPLIWDVVAVAATLWTISSIKIFDFILGSQSGGMPPLQYWNAAVFVYGESFGGREPAYQLGYAAAAAMVMVVLVAVVAVLLRRIFAREQVQF